MIKSIINRYKHIRSKQLLGKSYTGQYAFVGIGNHSTNNLYPVLSYLHVPLKYICCKSPDKLKLIEAAYTGVKATTNLQQILVDEDIKGVFVCTSPQSNFHIAAEVIKSGKAAYIEKPPCHNSEELNTLIEYREKADKQVVAVGLQKRSAPTIIKLRNEINKAGGTVTYNLKYLTGKYPEGDILTDLFIHPIDCIAYLFGNVEDIKMEKVENHTLFLIMKHKKAAGIVELSTNYSWNGSKEHLTVNTSKGIFELDQMEKLKWKGKPKSMAGVPLEKIFHQQTIKKNLVERNNFVPTLQNNQIYSQGYYDAIKNFIDRVENKYDAEITTLENIIETYRILDHIRHN